MGHGPKSNSLQPEVTSMLQVLAWSFTMRRQESSSVRVSPDMAMALRPATRKASLSESHLVFGGRRRSKNLPNSGSMIRSGLYHAIMPLMRTTVSWLYGSCRVRFLHTLRTISSSELDKRRHRG